MSPGPTPPALRSPPNKCLTVGGRADGGFLHYVQLLKPRNSMSITNTKGLLNMPGQNNCFLNSAVQVLWHLDIFRRSFRELGGHACMEDSCIFCALKELFAQFQYSQESALPPDALRRALAETFCDQRRFQLGFMDDAAECFENILMRIHFHIANNESEDMCSAVHCIPHQKFAMTLVEQTVCHACGATSEPLPFTQMVHYVPSSALCSQAKLMKEKNEPMPSFSELLKRAGGLGDLRDCPSSCGAVIQIRKTLMNRPEIVSVGLVWDSERPTIEHIMDVFKTIGMSLKLQDVFHSVVDSRWASTATHQLVGIVTYYGKHYSTFFFHTKLRVWIYFDDAAVREIGPKWEQVVEKCCKGHFQPLLLLYANPHGTPVNTSTAPRIVTVVPGHKKNLNGKDVCSGNLTHEKHARMLQHQNNQRRALTPNPEISTDMSANIQPRRAVTPSGELTWWDENMKEQNSKKSESNPQHNSNSKDNATLPLSHLEGYSKYTCFPKNSELDNSSVGSTTLECSTSLKNRLAARLSVPHLSFYHALRQSKNGTVDNGTSNQTVDDSAKALLDSGINFQPAPNSDSSSMDSTYISRQAVENVLQLQKLQRQRSMNNKNDNPFVGQRNSSSSLESLDNVFAKGQVSHLKLEALDAANVARRRDSGNWSGDRNSASSSSTTSLDNPYFYVLGNKRYPNTRHMGRPGDTPSLTDAGYDSFSLSSSDSYPSAINNSPGKLDSRLGQIQENVQTAFVPYDISQLQYCLKELKNNEQFPFGFKDECDKLCAEADIFVAKSVERENVGDISMAALLSDTAAAKARAAMDVPYTNSQALAMAKMKHSMCLIRSSNLHKKLKEAEAVLRRMQKESLAEASRKDSPSGNRTTADGIIGFSKEESENKPDENTKPSKKSPKHSEESPKSDKNIEIYATLPKRCLKKKGALSSFVESLNGDESSEEKHKSSEEVRMSPTKKFDGNSSLSDRDEKSVKSPKGKKKSQTLHRTQNKDSDLSDYSNEWEQTKKTALYRTYSGPTSKSELSDLNSSNQTFSEHPNKKQHRIRRKLMGGFMRRKNRSLPDLREGQDSGNETTRSYDDCFFTQIPTSCKKKQVNSSPPENNAADQAANAKVDKSHKKNLIRAHTPPPYKPPPPIAHSNSPAKKNLQTTNADNAKSNNQFSYPASIRMQQDNMMAQKVAHHPLLSRDMKSQRKLSAQPPPPDFTTGSAVWLKELQLKQEEMNRRRKQEEERKRWISDCTLAADGNTAGQGKKDCARDTASLNQSILSVDGNHHSTQSLPKQSYITHKGSSMSDLDNQKSVRDLTSKFETISFPPSVSYEASPEEKGRSLTVPSPHTQQEFYKPSEPNFKILHDNSETELCRYPTSTNFCLSPQDAATKQADYIAKSAMGDSKDRSFSSKMPYTTQATAGNLYNPHLTDAQLTNVLRIGTNRSSFRNSSSNVDGHEDSIGYHTRDSCGMHDQRRPDKPPDYETALQRLEFLRHDRGFSKLYCSSGINFEAILEQAKKRKGPKKSVTFSDKVVLVACAGDEDNDFIPNPLLERVYKQHFMQKPNVHEPPTQANADCSSKVGKDGSVPDTSQSTNDNKVTDFSKSPQSPCNLCHKKTIESPNLYCPDCSFYMSRFQQK